MNDGRMNDEISARLHAGESVISAKDAAWGREVLRRINASTWQPHPGRVDADTRQVIITAAHTEQLIHPPLTECEHCGAGYPSKLAAAECCSPVWWRSEN